MPRTITVNGHGKVSIGVDLVEMSIRLSNTDNDYSKAAELTKQGYDKLFKALCDAGFEKDSLKTSDYSVRADYSGLHTPDGKYIKEFQGFVCAHSLKLSFPFSNDSLTKAVNAVFDSLSNPDIDIRFTVADKSKAYDEMLRSATCSAMHNAHILCEASGVKLGTLLSVNYSDKDMSLYSPSSAKFASEDRGLLCANAIEVCPDDVVIEDTVTFVWEIQ